MPVEDTSGSIHPAVLMISCCKTDTPSAGIQFEAHEQPGRESIGVKSPRPSPLSTRAAALSDSSADKPWCIHCFAAVQAPSKSMGSMSDSSTASFGDVCAVVAQHSNARPSNARLGMRVDVRHSVPRDDTHTRGGRFVLVFAESTFIYCTAREHIHISIELSKWRRGGRLAPDGRCRRASRLRHSLMG